MFAGSYNTSLVVISVLVAILASYTALDMAGRINAAQGKSARWWLACGSFAMGIGIWAMHFIGMLAFSLPIPLGYDPFITLASLLIAVASSAFALWLVCRNHLPMSHLIYGALLMGTGVAGMHYTGMAAMQMHPAIHYSSNLVLLSLAIAVIASGAALWIAFHLRHTSTRNRLYRAGAAVIMGFAITGMHYTAMAAAHFSEGSMCGAIHSGVNNEWLALTIIIATLSVLSIALIASVLDARLESRTSILAASLADANQELTYLALHDNLTKLPNRALLEDRLSQTVRSANRDGSQFSVMFLDLDGFKGVNDAYGHHIGDLLLIEVAERIRTSVGPRDTIARLGGDEFVLLIETGEPTQAATLADNLITAMGMPFFIDSLELRVSASVGIAIHHGDDPNDNQDLIANADAAMYHAKALGRNCYCFFETSMNANAYQQVQLLHDLRLALEQHQLILHYQPKFNALTRTIVGAEALLRWQHPTRGLIPPDEFIPLAEKTGLIVPIGEWVLDEACRQMRLWRDTGYNNQWTVAVNLSALQFSHPGLIRMVQETLERHGLEPRTLTLEVTESTAMRNVESSMLILQQIYSMGINISIDDFGTGYSSLLHLKRLPANEIKIDRAFVGDVRHNSEDAAIVSAIVALGQTLNLKVVAEGVETVSQQEFLTRLGCDSMQGFLLGRPLPPDLFIEALSRNVILPISDDDKSSRSWKLVAQTE